MTTPSSSLHLAKNLSIDADYFAGSSVALLGKRGAGKTYACRAFAEELHDAAVQTVIIDPMGVFWGLRSNANGTKGGLPIPVFGGAHGDAPLEHTAGQLMADLAVDEGLSMVLDLSTFTSRTQERTFAREFFDRLYRKNRTLVHVIIDEADLFAPQRPRREDAPLLVTMENLVRRGRNKGIGVTMASQRPATINKDVLTQVDALIAMRVTAPQDRDAIREWVRGQGTDEQWQKISPSLPQLATGEAWWWVPERGVLSRVQGRKTRTFDSSPTKKRGQSARAPKTFADVDLSAITERMQATIERAQSTDPRALTKKIRDLENQLTTARATGPVTEVEVQEVSVLTDEDRALLREALAGLQQAHKSLETISATLAQDTAAITDHSENLHRLLSKATDAVSAAPNAQRHLHRAGKPTSRGPTPETGNHRPETTPTPVTQESGGPLAPTHRRILDALASMEEIGISPATKIQLALWVGLSPKSGNYANKLGHLRTAGLLDYPTPGHVILTAGGRALAAPDPTPVRTSQDLHQRLRSLKAITPKKWDILATLIQAYPHPMSKTDLAEEVGLSSSSGNYANNLGSLRSLGLLDYPARSQVIAADVLFLNGRSA